MANSKIPRRFIDLELDSSDGLTASSIRYSPTASIAEELNRLNNIIENLDWSKKTFRQDISNMDLDENGKILVKHNLNNLFNHVTLYDNKKNIAYAEIKAKTINTIELNLKEFQPLEGLWTVIISKISSIE